MVGIKKENSDIVDIWLNGNDTIADCKDIIKKVLKLDCIIYLFNKNILLKDYTKVLENNIVEGECLDIFEI